MPTMLKKKPAKKAAPAKAAPAGKKIKRVYFFGAGKAEGGADMKDLLGGKGANLADMTTAGLPVPPGFTITTESCGDYNKGGQKMPAGLMDEVRLNIAKVEKATGKKFGDNKNPLLVAARSGAKMSMPGMMDTVLNIGLNDVAVDGLAKLAGNERFAYDSYRRLINMFGDTVKGIDHEHFEHELSAVKKEAGVELDTDLDTEQLKDVVARYKPSTRRRSAKISRRIRTSSSRPPSKRCSNHGWAIAPSATARSTKSAACPARPSTCRRWSSATWVMTARPESPSRVTRRPARTSFYGEFLVNAQGEDVVAGIRTPLECKTEMGKWSTKSWKGTAQCQEDSSKHATRTCRTSNSRSKRASCTCCRPATASGPPPRR